MIQENEKDIDEDYDWIFEQLDREFDEDSKWPWESLGYCEQDLNDLRAK